jgi:hypothetical protein
MSIQNLQELKTLVVDNQGIVTIPMKELKDAAKQGESLKSGVREKITNELRKIGLEHTEKELPNSQYAHVRIYQSGSNVAKILEAAKLTDAQGDYDEILRRAASSDQTALLSEVKDLREEAAILDRIRDVLQCQE